MITLRATALDFIAHNEHVVLAEIVDAHGSTPRGTGTFMLIGATQIWGTIGGGQLENIVMERARTSLSDGGETVMELHLGPSIGQCCGGRVKVHLKTLDATDASVIDRRLRDEVEGFPSVFIFGAGHVGRALAVSLSCLPLSITVIETRQSELASLPQGIEAYLAAMPESLVKDMPSGSSLVILTHDHALDFLIASEALKRDDFAYVGMIGSATKRASFSNWLFREAQGQRAWLDRLTLPIGGGLVKDKRPEVIAAMTAAEILERNASWHLQKEARQNV